MAHYQVILAYDGTRFSGFQRQARARTVQGSVETALRRFGWGEESLLASGRTDTGVHATGQVITFNLDWKHSPEALLSALNANLPGDVAAQQIQQVPPGFHPRFDAISRRYQYHLVCQSIRNPLAERYAWRLWHQVDFVKLQEISKFFLGLHNFAAFGTPSRAGGSTTRCVLDAFWAQNDNRLIFDVTANAFLYHMVRRIVFIQIVAAQGKITGDELQASLKNGKDFVKRGIAPPQGLVLVKVNYSYDIEK